MQDFKYFKPRAYIIIVAVIIPLAALEVFFYLYASHKFFVGSCVAAGISALIFCIYILRNAGKYEARITDKAFIFCEPLPGGVFETVIYWRDVKNVTYFRGKYFPRRICVNAQDKRACIPLFAFAGYKEMLKSIIRHSCDNPGYYTEQKVLSILKN